MKQMHVFKSVEYYSSTLAVIALFKDSLPAVQIHSWESPGAIKPKALAKPPYHFFLLSCSLSLLAGSHYRAQCPSVVLLAKRRDCLLTAPGASLHARLFRKAYYCPGQCFSTGCKFTGYVKFNGSVLIYATEKLTQKAGTAALTSHPQLNGFWPAPLVNRVREALSRGDQRQVRSPWLYCEVRSLSPLSRLYGLGMAC